MIILFWIGLVVNDIEKAINLDTTISFASGIHTWEIVFPICINNVEFGVVSVADTKKFFRKFKTTTPRFVALTLNVEAQKLTYRLNKDPSTDKTIALEGEGPYRPFVNTLKAGQEVVLNPYPRLLENQKTLVSLTFKILFWNQNLVKTSIRIQIYCIK